MLKAIIETILLSPLSSRGWSQCQLSINNGGLGIGVDPLVAHAAYAASILSTLTSLRKVVPDFDGTIRTGNFSLPSLAAFNTAITTLNYNNYNAYEALSLVKEPIEKSTDKLQSTLLEAHKQKAFDSHLQSLGNDAQLIASLLGVATVEASAFS
jgi:hypothetical protein